MPRLFLFAYTCSGFAGLVYQVCWTRLLTLYIGHSTAAASAVVAAFLGGLAAGAAAGGAIASRLSPRASLMTYAALEIAVALAAFLFPWELRALTPVLALAYDNGTPGLAFPAIRLMVCMLLVFVPAIALGATFPMAIRWCAAGVTNHARTSSALYALNTAGAAVGAVLAGFVLIPRLGISGTTLVGIVASIAAAGSVLMLMWHTNAPPTPAKQTRRMPTRSAASLATRETAPHWLASLTLGLSGFAALLHEIAWTRILTLVLGPTTYAFAATLAAVITGVAIGSSIGTWIVARTRRPAFWLAMTLAASAITSGITSWLAGGPVPRLVAAQMAASPNLFDQLLWQGGLLTTALILPTAACLGAAFPLALAMVDDPSRSAARQFGSIYAINTIGAVGGSLAAAFVLIPEVGLEGTLRIVGGVLIVTALLVALVAGLPKQGRMTIAGGIAIAVLLIAVSPRWDRAILASGVYIYAPFVPKGVDVDALLRAGTQLYYREGAAATVSVKRLTGTTTLAVDGKTDASNRSDMLTQKLVAHLPLLLHDTPRDVAIVGLGSGVTVGAALTHPVSRVDVLELSPEVVEASAFFARENRGALGDTRTNLIVADGRSHLLLSKRRYDVIISEPSNPWIAGVASLFTREFFMAARARLAAGGIICQWANAYNISGQDLRSIVATFQSVFPHGTAWLVGADDVLLIASDGPLDDRLDAIKHHWSRPGVAGDLQLVGATEPFSLWSLFVAGPAQLQRYGAGAPILDDDHMTLEFSAPRELHGRGAGENGAILAALRGPDDGPRAIHAATASATAAQWRDRGVMMTMRDAHANAFDDYVKALTLDPSDTIALDGLVRTAVITKRGSDALSWLKALTDGHPVTPQMMVARSKLLTAIDADADALTAARDAVQIAPPTIVALEQLASLYAESGEISQLGAIVERLRTVAPGQAATHYYAGVAAFLQGNAASAREFAEAAVASNPEYAAAYDLLGAALTKQGQHDRAREAFDTSLRYDAHDSSAYANLGILDLQAGDRAAAASHFAEALWLDAQSQMARQGLSVALAAGPQSRRSPDARP